MFSRAFFIAVRALDESVRGVGGHGSTGGMPGENGAAAAGLNDAQGEGRSR